MKYFSGAFLMAFSLLLAACDTYSYFDLTVYHLPQEEFPAQSSSLVLVDNSVSQPADYGNGFVFPDNDIRPTLLDKKNYASVYLEYILSKLQGSHLLQDVAIYNSSLRNDTMWQVAPVIPPYRLDTVFHNTGMEWVLSLDRLSSSQVATVRERDMGLFQASMVSMMTPVLSLYNINDSSLVKRYVISDTLTWDALGLDAQQAASNFIPALTGEDSEQEILHQSMENLARKTCQRFLPYKTRQPRFYIVSSNAAMRAADEYRRKSQMQEAAYMWEYVYENYSSRKSRASAAFNLSTYYESKGDYDASLKWFEKVKSQRYYTYIEGVSIEELEAQIRANQKHYREMKEYFLR